MNMTTRFHTRVKAKLSYLVRMTKRTASLQSLECFDSRGRHGDPGTGAGVTL